jgi:hypothetical protein
MPIYLAFVLPHSTPTPCATGFFDDLLLLSHNHRFSQEVGKIQDASKSIGQTHIQPYAVLRSTFSLLICTPLNRKLITDSQLPLTNADPLITTTPESQFRLGTQI